MAASNQLIRVQLYDIKVGLSRAASSCRIGQVFLGNAVTNPSIGLDDESLKAAIK